MSFYLRQLFLQNVFLSIIEASLTVIMRIQEHNSDQAVCIGPKALYQLEYDLDHEQGIACICFLSPSLM